MNEPRSQGRITSSSRPRWKHSYWGS